MSVCPVCDFHRLQTNHHGISLCEQCTHMFQRDLTPTVDYRGDYGDRTYNTYPLDTAYLRAGYVLGRTQLGEGARALDIGYGSGSFLSLLGEAGLLAFGHDVHERVDGIARGDLEDRYDVTTLFDSLEHIPNIRGLPLRTRHCMVSIPHCPDWFFGTPERWRHFKPGEHLHYFTPRSLTLFMECRGLGFRHRAPIEDIIRKPQKGLSANIMTYHFSR